jgi:hypothetical protein
LKSPPGTPEFNAELGRMNGLSLPVIMLPTMVVTMVVLWKLMSGLTQITVSSSTISSAAGRRRRKAISDHRQLSAFSGDDQPQGVISREQATRSRLPQKTTEG